MNLMIKEDNILNDSDQEAEALHRVTEKILKALRKGKAYNTLN